MKIYTFVSPSLSLFEPVPLCTLFTIVTLYRGSTDLQNGGTVWVESHFGPLT